MQRLISLSALFILFCSHDMFFKMDSFFIMPDQQATLHLYNGTFEKSDNVITRDRMTKVVILESGMVRPIDSSMWSEEGNITVLNFQSGQPGTSVAGVSTFSRNIELSAEDFNGYLEHDGVLDMIEKRKIDGTTDQPAVEKYSKHVKAIFQVGDLKTEDYKIALDYPIEFIPETNPYNVQVGDKMKVKLLRDGQPLPNQLVYSGFGGGASSHQHESGEDGKEQEVHVHDEHGMRTDANGLVEVKIDHGGQWYLRTIHMTLSEEPGLTHESNWATLTFEVAGPVHSHKGITSYVNWGVGLILLFGLFLYFRRK